MKQILENLLHEFETPFSSSVLVFSLILAIILLVPLIFNRFKIPGIIGLIISGIIIGPHGLFLIEKNSAVDLFSTIGLLYIMFIAGLELDLAEFKKNKNKSLLFGFLTFLIPIALGLPACLYILKYPLNSSLLTASMFATHTLIAYPIVNRLGISKNQAVATAVGGTILTDSAVLLLLAVITGSAEVGLSSDFWIGLILSILFFLVIVVLVIPKISSWFFKRLEDEKHAHFIYVLSVVFFCAFLADLSGLEPILGAFAAGLTLNRLIPHRSTLMNRIEFVGNALFIPFFLISVGMLIDIKVLTNGSQAILVAIVLTTVALAGKWLAAYLTGLLLKYTKPEMELVFGLSSAHAAATLAVILVGYRIGFIDDNILNGTVVLILVTCVVASFSTERAAKRLILEMDIQPEITVSTQQILVPIANPETMEKLIDFAIVMKNATDHSPIIAVTVVKDNEQAQTRLVESKKLLEKALAHATSADQKVEILSTIDRNVTVGIKRVIKERFITDIVLGWSEKNNIADIIFGRTFDSLIKQTTQNIFITRFVQPINTQHTLVLICPEFVEKEVSFFNWLQSILNAAYHLRMKLDLFSTEDVNLSVLEFIKMTKQAVQVTYKGVFDYRDTRTMKALIKKDDLVVFPCSREGGISYHSMQDALPKRVSNLLTSNNLLFVYPATSIGNTILNYEKEATGGMLDKTLNFIKNAIKGNAKND